MKKRSMAELERISAEQFKMAEKMPVVIVLDDVRSAYNVGSIFRTADAFRIEGIRICGISARPPHKDISKTALGATESVDWKYYSVVEEAVAGLRNAGFRIYAVEQADESVFLQDFTPARDEKIAIVFGHEVFGVKEEVLKMADGCIEIPQFGTKHSFNVAISAGIVLWDISLKIR
ncbi:MAG TPA: RNA methyltransferase [Bacteroidales bacterium]|nr:RNA methyltransferase [Bacteroidales bacterium]HPI86012.1 RNA methyltransferase [Bacteroidales bacterium]HPM92601.1 RNA methyltransferase [Bacteroidales bacterium]